MENEENQLKDLAGDVFQLAELLDYQEGAIVSRTLVNKESVTITVFSFDAGQALSEHTAPHNAILQVIDGNASVTIEDETYEMTMGETIVLPADIPHAVHAPENFKMFLTMVR